MLPRRRCAFEMHVGVCLIMLAAGGSAVPAAAQQLLTGVPVVPAAVLASRVPPGEKATPRAQSRIERLRSMVDERSQKVSTAFLEEVQLRMATFGRGRFELSGFQHTPANRLGYPAPGLSGARQPDPTRTVGLVPRNPSSYGLSLTIHFRRRL